MRFRLLLRDMICDLSASQKKQANPASLAQMFKRSGNVQDCWMRFLCSSRHWWLWFKLIMMVRLCWTVDFSFQGPWFVIMPCHRISQVPIRLKHQVLRSRPHMPHAHSNFTDWFRVAFHATKKWAFMLTKKFINSLHWIFSAWSQRRAPASTPLPSPTSKPWATSPRRLSWSWSFKANIS